MKPKTENCNCTGRDIYIIHKCYCVKCKEHQSQQTANDLLTELWAKMSIATPFGNHFKISRINYEKIQKKYLKGEVKRG